MYVLYYHVIHIAKLVDHSRPLVGRFFFVSYGLDTPHPICPGRRMSGPAIGTDSLISVAGPVGYPFGYRPL